MQKLDLAGLYRDDVYPAWNWAGFAAFALPVGLTVMAIGNSSFSWFYDYGWFTGSLLGGVLYYALGGLAGGQDSARLNWLYEEFAKLLAQEVFRSLERAPDRA